jgi:DMSO reductase anchor subunit
MRPTFSIILFTVLSGAGYGLLFLLGLDLAIGASMDVTALPAALAVDPRFAIGITLVIGFALTSIGLGASVAHLGKPLRAWRAFSQWRSSWLSREGIAAVLTFLPLAAIAIVLVTQPAAQSGLRVLGLLLALACTATVFCTARIYSSLPPIRAWHNRHTLPGYLLLGLYSGALWFVAVQIVTATRDELRHGASLAVIILCVLLGPACALFKQRYWRLIDAQGNAPDAGAATGLDRLGKVARFEQPHTEENYLTHEMGFVLARKHAHTLRAIAFWLIALAPFAMLAAAWLGVGPAAWFALALGMLGIFVERWLFFAQARHAVMAYYGR